MDKGKLSSILLIVATILIAISVFTRTWFMDSKGQASFNFGLRSIKFCTADNCETTSMSDFVKESKGAMLPSKLRKPLERLPTMGTLVFVAGLISMAAWLAFAFFAFKRHPKAESLSLPILLWSIAAFALGIAYVIMRPAKLMPPPAVGVYFFYIACVLGAVAAILIRSKPEEDYLAEQY